MADKATKRALNVAMGWTRPTLAVYPALDPTAPWGVAIVGGAGAWGGYADIIGNTVPAIATEFWLLNLIIGVPNAAALFEIQVYDLTTLTTVYECRADLINVASVYMPPFEIPIPIWCAPNDNIQGRCSEVGGGRIRVSLLVATGL